MTLFPLDQNNSNSISYSTLLKKISSGEVESIVFIPNIRQVDVLLKDGRFLKVPVLRNDQQILRAAESSKTPLTVKDLRGEQALASSLGTIGFVLIFLVLISFLIRRTVGIANTAMRFGSSNPRIKPIDLVETKLDDVAGISEVSEELEELIDFLNNSESMKKLGARTPRGVLLIGPPGTGKTLLAKAIAGESQVPFFSIAASEFVELFVGVGASRVRDLFKKAKDNSPCIVFVDEIDAIGRQRGTGIGGGNDEREQTLNQLLTEMDGFSDNSGVIVLAATNRADVLDSALLRSGRFDRRLYLSLPDRLAREKILSVHARKLPISEEVSLYKWSIRTPGFSGAELANLLNEAAIITARNNLTKISNDHIDVAFEKITIGIEASPLQVESKKRLIAYREIATAIVSNSLPKTDQLDKITLIPRQKNIGGYTRLIPDEETIDSGLITKRYLNSKLIITLAGRASEIIVFGNEEVTQGTNGDLEIVAQIAREMVTKFGFSQLGPIALEDNDSKLFLGKDLIKKNNIYSESTSKAIDIQIRFLALRALKEAIKIITPKRELMDRLVDILIEEETIDNKRFQELLNNH